MVSLFATVDGLGGDGLVLAANLGNEYFRYDEAARQLVGDETGETYRQGQKLTLRLVEANPVSGSLSFELPEGSVRHYQSTDDGEQLPAILMFHPDYEFVNEAGQVVKLPEDGIVPPEMAPPGLKTDQVLEVPERKRGEPLR